MDIIYRYDAIPDFNLGPRDSEEAQYRLETGNRQFADLVNSGIEHPEASQVIPFDLHELGVSELRNSAPRQVPFAVVLGCCDARVPTEMVFSQACNDLFVIRIVGNVLGSDCLGSINYAVTHLKEHLKLLVVLGHSNCGAVTAAVDAFLDPDQYLALAPSHALRSVVDRLFMSVRGANRAIERLYGSAAKSLPGYRKALIEIAIVLNAASTAYTLRVEALARESQAKVVFGIYDLVDHRVGLPIPTSNGRFTQLSTPPTAFADFEDLMQKVAGGDIIRQLLYSGT